MKELSSIKLLIYTLKQANGLRFTVETGNTDLSIKLCKIMRAMLEEVEHRRDPIAIEPTEAIFETLHDRDSMYNLFKKVLISLRYYAQ